MVTETSNSYQSAAIEGGVTKSNESTKTTKLAVSTNSSGKPIFEKTVEGCNVERKFLFVIIIIIIFF